MEKKILAAVDGSVFSSNSLDYLIRLFENNPEIHIHLVSIVSAGSSDQNWMLDVDPLRKNTPMVERRTALATKYLRDARSRLLRNGFNDEQITFAAEASTGSIAKALHHQAVSGMYDALLIGRRGVGKVGEMFFGSVSAELIETCHQVPLWIIDGEVTSTSFLLAVHPVPQSLLAADHLAFFTGSSPNAQINLYHSNPLFGWSPEGSPREHFHDRWGREWCDEYLDLENYLFGAHATILMHAGVSKNKIRQLKVHKNLDASQDLLKQAKKHNCGTIVIGRRGPGESKGLLGGVSERTMKSAQNVAVWLVG